MSRSERSHSFSVNSQHSHMDETQRLQDGADKYTKKYEWQRRNLMTLKNVEASLQQELANLKTNLTKLKRDCDKGKLKLMFT